MANKQRNRRARAGRPAAMPREVRAAYREMQQGVQHLDASIADLRAGLRRAEAKIEADARARIRQLRRDVRSELRSLQSRQREAARLMAQLSSAAGDSWRVIRRSATSIFADARRTGTIIARRFRRALTT